jgi:hypothetical protein
MTKFQKQMLTIAAAGALTAVTALPAMAFENEFHGMFAVKTFLSNFDNGASGAMATRDKVKTNNYTEQRTRIQYTAKASDDLKLVTHFEMNTRWGVEYAAAATGVNASGGGDIDTDSNNLLVKHAYLDFNIGKSLNVKAGQQAYVDTIKGLYVDADLPMAYAAYKAGAYTLGLGYGRFNDTDTSLTGNSFSGNRSADLYAVDNTYALSKDTKLKFSYYLNIDDSLKTTGDSKKVHTLGLGGETQMGGLQLSGFAAMQAGYQKNAFTTTTQNYHGWAANAAAKMKVGSGTAKTTFLFVSGNNSSNAASNKGWQTLSAAGSATSSGAVQNSYNESGMMLLVRNTSMGGTSTDGYIRKPITNIALATIGYDASLSEKLYMNGNVGFAWLPASAYLNGGTMAATGVQPDVANGSDFMGTEVNLETGYKLYKNLTLKAQAAYVMLGAAYKNTATNNAGVAADPANPWTMRLGAHYSF